MRLVTIHVNGYSLNKCPHCSGLWVPHDELENIVKLGRNKIEAGIKAVEEEGMDYFGKDAAYMRCPKCIDGRLQRIRFTILSSVEVDRCNKCMGYWMDQDELDSILFERERLEAWDYRALQQHAVAKEHRGEID